MHNQPDVPQSATSAFSVPLVPMPNMTDEDVMEQLRQGHPDALPILFDRYYRLVLKVALRILRDLGEAEDVTQDIFLEIFNKANQFDRYQGTAKIWNLTYAYQRSLSRRQYLAVRNVYDRRQTTEAEVAELNKVDVSWRGLTVGEWRDVIQHGLATLNEKQRKTIELACFHGLLL